MNAEMSDKKEHVKIKGYRVKKKIPQNKGQTACYFCYHFVSKSCLGNSWELGFHRERSNIHKGYLLVCLKNYHTGKDRKAATESVLRAYPALSLFLPMYPLFSLSLNISFTVTYWKLKGYRRTLPESSYPSISYNINGKLQKPENQVQQEPLGPIVQKYRP